MHAMKLAPVLLPGARVEALPDEYIVHLAVHDGDVTSVTAFYTHDGLELHIPRRSSAQRFALNPDASGV